MKFQRLAYNIVALFLLTVFFITTPIHGLWPILLFAVVAVVGIIGIAIIAIIEKSPGEPPSGAIRCKYFCIDICRYAIIFAGYVLIRYIAWSVLPSLKFDSFLSGALLFIGSAIVLGILAKYVVKGVGSIIDFPAWGENPAQNFMRLATAFIALLAGLNWISGVTECGLAGALSLLGIALGFIPNKYFDAIFLQSTAISESKPQEIYRDSVTLSNGTVVTDNGHGMFMDSNSHEWKKDSNGNWYDDGFQL